jgi:hypothetical protein
VEFRRLLLETALSAATRQMHLGVFVLGAGNHSAGRRWEGAAVSNNDLAVIQEIARIAEQANSTCCSSPTVSTTSKGICRRSCAASSRRA